ncbi:hypothetical protein [Novosphingobium sp. BW1]|uniref:hypothetical protein n=1 Tax=Novosphingobium sp. BW1 TaxID=2592621 RepID=UPI0011DE7920|nr:hypothetical protein [Novosphingobium sp. BW1]TYC89626.1 hypothetical protein FMM79_09445 [Novosphingobium sp. BW1]
MKPGTRLKSATCDTEVMVIRAGQGTIECGGAPMTEDKQSTSEPATDHANGTLIGKRYVDAEATFELLCVKPGKGSLAVDGTPLVTKDAKPLPASD